MHSATLRKIVRECAASDEPPIKVKADEQIEFLDGILKSHSEKNGDVSFSRQWEDNDGFRIIQLWVSGEAVYFGFSKKRQALFCSSDFSKLILGDEECFSVGNVDGFINSVVTSIQLQKQRKKVTQKFEGQGVKTRVAALSKELDLIWAIDKKPLHYLIYLANKGCNPLHPSNYVVVIKLSSAKKNVVQEMESLPEYMNHAATHLKYCAKVTRATGGSKGYQYNHLKFEG